MEGTLVLLASRLTSLDEATSLVFKVCRLKLPPAVRDAWWNGTTPQWPLMAADLHMSRDTLMAHYQSNHIAVAYGDIFEELVALSQQLGLRVRVMGNAAA